MRLIADMHISPATVAFLLSIGHDVIRVNNALSASAPDKDIVAWAAHNNRTILTQDLDFSTLVALSGKTSPSVISLRLSSSRIDYVNAILAKILPSLENEVVGGIFVTVEDRRIRKRHLPIP